MERLAVIENRLWKDGEFKNKPISCDQRACMVEWFRRSDRMRLDNFLEDVQISNLNLLHLKDWKRDSDFYLNSVPIFHFVTFCFIFPYQWKNFYQGCFINASGWKSLPPSPSKKTCLWNFFMKTWKYRVFKIVEKITMYSEDWIKRIEDDRFPYY